MDYSSGPSDQGLVDSAEVQFDPLLQPRQTGRPARYGHGSSCMPCKQFLAIFMKNMIQEFRSLKAACIKTLVPIGILLIVGLVTWSTSGSETKLVSTLPAYAPHGVKSPVTVIYAPSVPWVDEVMKTVAEQNDLSFNKDGSLAQVMALANSVSFKKDNKTIIESAYANMGKYGSAVLFYDAYSNPDTMPSLPLDVRYIANSTDSIRAAQVTTAVQKAIYKQHTGFSLDMESEVRSWPDSSGDEAQKVILGSLGFLPGALVAFMISTKVVADKDRRLRLGMRAVGVGNIPYWLGYGLYAFLSTGFFSLLFVITGYCMKIPFFLKANFLLIWILYWSMYLAMCMQSFVIATFFSRSVVMVVVGSILIGVDIVIQLIMTIGNGVLIQLLFLKLHIKATWWWLSIPLSTYPGFIFAVQSSIMNSFEFPTKSITSQDGGDPPVGKFGFAEFFKNPEHADIPMFSGLLDTYLFSVFYWWLIQMCLGMVYFLLAMYFDCIIPSDHGKTHAPWFFMDPSYYGFFNKKTDVEFKDACVREKSQGVYTDQDVATAAAEATQDYAYLKYPLVLVQTEKTYRSLFNPIGARAVNGVSLAVEQGQCLALLGHNGAGKTTIISALTGQIGLTDGFASVQGLSVVDRMDDIRQITGYCPQHDILWEELTAAEHIVMFGLFKGMPFGSLWGNVRTRLGAVGLYKERHHRVGTFSGGMKRRLSCALASLGDPGIIFLDEPTTGMDPATRRQAWKMIEELKKDRVIVLTTHSMEEADLLGDKIAIMAHGSIRAFGDSLHLKNRFGSGTRLNLVVDSEKMKKAEDVIMSIAPDAKLLHSDSGAMTFVFENQQGLVTILKQLESGEHSKLIREYGIAQTSLEDVFLKVSKDSNFDYNNAPVSSNNLAMAHESREQTQLRMQIAAQQQEMEEMRRMLMQSQGQSSSAHAMPPSETHAPAPNMAPAIAPQGALPVLPSGQVPSNMVQSVIDSQYAPVNQQYAPVNQQYAPVNQQYAPVNQQYAPVNQQYTPVNQQYTPVNQQYTPVNQPTAGGPVQQQPQAFVSADDEEAPKAMRRVNVGMRRELYALAWKNFHFHRKQRCSNVCQICLPIVILIIIVMANTSVMYVADQLGASGGMQRNYSKDYYGPSAPGFSTTNILYGFDTGKLTQNVVGKLNTKESIASGFLGGMSTRAKTYYYEDVVCKEPAMSSLSQVVNTIKSQSYSFLSNENTQCGLFLNSLDKAKHAYKFTTMQHSYVSDYMTDVSSEMWFVDAINQATTTFDFGSKMTVQRPEYSYFSFDSSVFESYIQSLAVLIGMCFVLQFIIYVYALVAEKVDRQREMMVGMGTPLVSIWFSHYTWFYFMYFISFLSFYIVAFVSGVKLIRDTNIIIVFLLFTTWGHALIGWAFFCSAFINSKVFARIFSVIASLVASVVAFVFASSQKTSWVYYFLPVYPFVKNVRSLADACYNYNRCFGFDGLDPTKEFMQLVFFNILSGFVLIFLGVYFDMVLPQKFGNRRNPCCCIIDPIMCLFGFLNSGDGDVQRNSEEPDTLTQEEADAINVDAKFGDVELMVDDAVEQEKARVKNMNSYKDHPMVVKNLRKSYGRKKAVRGVDLVLEENQVFGLLGPNGAGKSTTINMLCGAIMPSGGTAYVDGHNIRHGFSQINQIVGICPQFDLLWSELSCRQHLLFYARVKGVRWTEEGNYVDTLLKNVGLFAFRNREAGKLSGGMKRRLSIAISIIGNSRIVFLDEPTTGLDPVSRRHIWSVVTDARDGRAIVLTTHAMDEAEVLSSRIGIIAGGRMQCLGTQQELKNRYANGYQLQINFRPDTMQIVFQMVEQLLPNATVLLSTQSSATWQIDGKKIELSKIFTHIEENKWAVGIREWGLSQATLEDVFMRIADNAMDE